MSILFFQSVSLTECIITSKVEKAFVLGVRALEYALGLVCDNTFAIGVLTDEIAQPAFEAALPIITKLSAQYNISISNNANFNTLLASGGPSIGAMKAVLGKGRQRHCLSTQ